MGNEAGTSAKDIRKKDMSMGNKYFHVNASCLSVSKIKLTNIATDPIVKAEISLRDIAMCKEPGVDLSCIKNLQI